MSHQRPQVPLRRLFLLTVVTAVLAFLLQLTLAAANAPAAEVLSLLLIPPVAGGVIYTGLRPYPTAGRIRIALMVAFGLFVLGLLLS